MSNINSTLMKGALAQLRTAQEALIKATAPIDIQWVLSDLILNLEEEIEGNRPEGLEDFVT